MACFLVAVAEAAITTVAAKAVKSHEKHLELSKTQLEGTNYETTEKIPFSRKLKWLSNMLWGGSALLAFEHIWHGEIVPLAPFFTSAGNPADFAAMLSEMAVTGVAMTAMVTAVWLGMVGVTSIMEKRALKSQIAKD